MRMQQPVAMQIGANGMPPHQTEAYNARRDADWWLNHVSGAYAALGKPHPLAWTIAKLRTEALSASARPALAREIQKAAAKPLSHEALDAAVAKAEVKVWRKFEADIRAIDALRGDKLTEAVRVQQAEIDAIGAATVARSPAPPPAPKSSAAEALRELLRRRGVTLSVSGNRIAAAPASALTSANIEALRMLKADMLALLRHDTVEV